MLMDLIVPKSRTLSQPNDFAADVLDILQRKEITFHGCRPESLEQFPNGDIKIWFYGDRNDSVVKGPWRGGITVMKRTGLDNAYMRGDSKVFAEAIMACIDEINARHA